MASFAFHQDKVGIQTIQTRAKLIVRELSFKREQHPLTFKLCFSEELCQQIINFISNADPDMLSEYKNLQQDTQELAIDAINEFTADEFESILTMIQQQPELGVREGEEQEREQFEQEQKEQAEIRNATTMQAMEDASLLERAKSELSPEVYDIYELSLLKNSYYSNSNNTTSSKSNSSNTSNTTSSKSNSKSNSSNTSNTTSNGNVIFIGKRNTEDCIEAIEERAAELDINLALFHSGNKGPALFHFLIQYDPFNGGYQSYPDIVWRCILHIRKLSFDDINALLAMLRLSPILGQCNLQLSLIQKLHSGIVDDVAQAIEAGVDTNIMDDEHFHALTWAASNGNVDVCQLLIAKNANVNAVGNTTALICAIYAGKVDIVKLLIEGGADVNVASKNGDLPLIASLCDIVDINIIQQLLNAGANVNGRDGNLSTALMQACSYTRLELVDIVKILIGKDADVNIFNAGGLTAIGIALALEHKNIVELLLESGADGDISVQKKMKAVTSVQIGDDTVKMGGAK